MKTFAQLKRDLVKGTTIKTIYNHFKPERNGEIRKIGKVQKNAIAFEIPQEQQVKSIWGEIQTLSWLWWTKASNYEYEENIFKVYDEVNGKKELSFIYEII